MWLQIYMEFLDPELRALLIQVSMQKVCHFPSSAGLVDVVLDVGFLQVQTGECCAIPGVSPEPDS